MENESNRTLKIHCAKEEPYQKSSSLLFQKYPSLSLSFPHLIDHCRNSCSRWNSQLLKTYVTQSHPMPWPWLDLWWLLYQASHEQTWKEEPPPFFLFHIGKVLWYTVWSTAGLSKYYESKRTTKVIISTVLATTWQSQIAHRLKAKLCPIKNNIYTLKLVYVVCTSCIKLNHILDNTFLAFHKFPLQISTKLCIMFRMASC
jgi:hypothetical protein